jgi:hypothetical protein
MSWFSGAAPIAITAAASIAAKRVHRIISSPHRIAAR